jgi:threonine synthase
VVLATAHAAKFPQLVERVTGRAPGQPERLRLRLGQHERCTTLPNDYAAVADFIAGRAHLEGGRQSPGRRAGVGA